MSARSAVEQGGGAEAVTPERPPLQQPIHLTGWVCVGHSHVVALSRAGGDAMDCINFWEIGDLWAHRDGPRPLREDLADRVARGRVVVSAIGGSAHVVLGNVEHDRPFDFVLPSQPDLPLDETREIVPAESVRQTIADLAAPLLRGVPALAQVVTGSLFHLAPPPPLAIVKFVRGAFEIDAKHFIGKTGGTTPKWPRYKMWRLHCEIIEAYCAEHGVRYLGSPSAANDPEGFLHPDFDADGVHGNVAYGRLALEDVQRAL